MQQWLFWIVVLVVLAVLLPRLWALRLLYADADVRGKARAALERTMEDSGWLPSDVLVRSVTHDRMRVDVRPHHRGTDASSCLLLPFEQTKPIFCDSSR